MNTLITSLVGFCVALVLVGCDNKPTQPPPPQETVCGTIRGLTCPDGQYCDFGVGQCKVADAQGTCKTKPTICTREFNPVCGCDGKTYGNACDAAGAGVSIDHPGKCTPPKPQACGGIAGIKCTDDQTCIDDPGDSCDPTRGGADCPGIRKAKKVPPAALGESCGFRTQSRDCRPGLQCRHVDGPLDSLTCTSP